jgi:hypothetical protein
MYILQGNIKEKLLSAGKKQTQTNPIQSQKD